jgi:L-malate glycosyltransferase
MIPVLMMARELGLGGIERDVSKFARHIRKHGIEPHVACFNPGGARWREIESAGIPVVPIRITSFKSRSALDGAKLFRDYVQRHNIRVVHAFDVPTDVFGVPLARLARVPVTISSQLCYRELSPPHMRALLAVIDRVATGLFVNCEAIREHLANDWKVSRKRIHVCYNGVETNEFHASGRSRPPALADASVVIGTVAVLREEKNLPALIQAFAEVHNVDPRAKLLIVGSGPMRDDLQRQAAQLGVSQAAMFQEASPNPADWMRAIDIFALPSRSEAFSNALLEAMACGCCPIGSRLGGTPELIAENQRGLLFEPGNTAEFTEKLKILTLDEGRRRAMGEASAAFVRDRLNMDVASAKLAAIYTSLVERK